MLHIRIKALGTQRLLQATRVRNKLNVFTELQNYKANGGGEDHLIPMFINTIHAINT
jgi:hypothetical protein